MKSDLIVPLGLINEPTPPCTTHPPIPLISEDNILLNPSSSGQSLSSPLFSLVCMPALPTASLLSPLTFFLFLFSLFSRGTCSLLFIFSLQYHSSSYPPLFFIILWSFFPTAPLLSLVSDLLFLLAPLLSSVSDLLFLASPFLLSVFGLFFLPAPLLSSVSALLYLYLLLFSYQFLVCCSWLLLFSYQALVCSSYVLFISLSAMVWSSFPLFSPVSARSLINLGNLGTCTCRRRCWPWRMRGWAWATQLLSCMDSALPSSAQECVKISWQQSIRFTFLTKNTK